MNLESPLLLLLLLLFFFLLLLSLIISVYFRVRTELLNVRPESGHPGFWVLVGVGGEVWHWCGFMTNVGRAVQYITRPRSANILRALFVVPIRTWDTQTSCRHQCVCRNAVCWLKGGLVGCARQMKWFLALDRTPVELLHRSSCSDWKIRFQLFLINNNSVRSLKWGPRLRFAGLLWASCMSGFPIAFDAIVGPLCACLDRLISSAWA